jgi:hypothetical protein
MEFGIKILSFSRTENLYCIRFSFSGRANGDRPTRFPGIHMISFHEFIGEEKKEIGYGSIRLFS